MLLAARATPARAGGTVVIPGSPSCSGLDDRGWVSLASVIGPGAAAARRGRLGTVSACRLAAATGRRASYRRSPDDAGPLQAVPAGRLGPSRSAAGSLWRLRNVHDLPECVRAELPRRVDCGSWPGARAARERMSVPRAGRHRLTDVRFCRNSVWSPPHSHARRRIAMHAPCDQLRRALQLYSFPAITRNAEYERLPGQHRQHRGGHRLSLLLSGSLRMI
jgi:hypothetical protein